MNDITMSSRERPSTLPLGDRDSPRCWAHILVQVTIYRRLLIGRDGHLDQSEAYDISQLVREYGP